jgi:XTP/dITP diphosphohydrolase
MKRLLIATTNEAKLAEYRLLLGGFEIEPVSLGEVGCQERPEEGAASFAENALAKARFYFARAGLATLADDGGLEVDALGGEPGVRSHRWLGADSDDRTLAHEVIRRMQGVEAARRTARIRGAVALVYRFEGRVRERVAEAAIEGLVADELRGEPRAGFPYRSLLFLPERGLCLSDLSEEEAAVVGHRHAALAKLGDDLKRLAADD